MQCRPLQTQAVGPEQVDAVAARDRVLDYLRLAEELGADFIEGADHLGETAAILRRNGRHFRVRQTGDGHAIARGQHRLGAVAGAGGRRVSPRRARGVDSGAWLPPS